MKTLLTFIAILPLFCNAQTSGTHETFANIVILPKESDKTIISDSLHRFNILIGSSAYQLTDTSKWVVLDTAATLATLLDFVITMQNTEKYHQRLWQKLEAASNILRVLNVNGYVRKKDMPEFINARDAYIKLNSKP